MTLAPLLQATPAIQVHAFAAIAALVLGIVQLSAPKGTLPHRTLGWIWVGLMLVVCITAFFIHELRMWGPWSPIHLLAIFTLVMLPRRGHARTPARCAASSRRDDRHLRRRAGHRRALHVLPGPHHVRSRVWSLTNSCVGACPIRKTGIHFSGTCANPLAQRARRQ